MNQQEAIDLARQVFTRANEIVKTNTGKSVVETAFDLAAPAITKQMPAVAILLPMLKRLILPMIEKSLTSDQYTQIAIAIADLEQAMDDITDRAAAARALIEGMSEEQVEAYLRKEGLIRSQP
jgi:hypothetical protein